MFSDLASIRSQLKDFLGPLVPGDWRIEEAMREAPASSSRPILYLQFKRLEGSYNSTPLPEGSLVCEFDLVIASARTGDGPAEDEVDEHVLAVAVALQKSDDIIWSDAVKERLTTGPFTWRVSASVLVTINHTTT